MLDEQEKLKRRQYDPPAEVILMNVSSAGADVMNVAALVTSDDTDAKDEDEKEDAVEEDEEKKDEEKEADDKLEDEQEKDQGKGQRKRLRQQTLRLASVPTPSKRNCRTRGTSKDDPPPKDDPAASK